MCETLTIPLCRSWGLSPYTRNDSPNKLRAHPSVAKLVHPNMPLF